MSYRHRSRYLRRWRRGRKLTARDLAAPAITGLLLAVLVHATGHVRSAASPAPSGSVAAQVISFATAREGCPYVYGGTGPYQDGYDCSGLTMDAYASAGVSIPRTAAEQWDAGPQVSTPEPGDLVFFVGADGTWSAPGHVAIYVGPHELIDAYATGFNVQEQSFGLPSSWGGLQTPVGYTDPAAGGSS